MKKKVIIIISIILILIIGGIVGVSLFMPMASPVMGGDVAFVTKVADLNGTNLAFSSNRYSGIVEMQELESVKADADKIIKKTYVKEGDTVKEGDKLFEYDIDQMELQRSQYQLDLDQAQSEITLSNSQIATLENQKVNANQNELLSIESQILSLQLQIKKAEYTKSTSSKEIEKLDKAIKDNVIKAKTDGKIQSVGNEDELSAGLVDDNAYIKIATNDNYRIKSMISEENIDTFSKDSPVIIRSRLDETKTWTGKVSSVDKTSPSKSDDMTGGDGDTKYPVYIALDSTDGLMIGQHISIELDTEKDTDTNKLKIAESYICDVDTAPYVWCMNKSNVLEKRTVKLGEYDAEGFTYEIISGITQEDYIAFPEEHLVEGMGATVIDIPAEMLGAGEPVEVQL